MQAMVHCKKNHSALHLYGLLSDGGVHSHNTHLSALLRMAKKNDLEQVFVHVFLDGRDTPPTSGVEFTAQLEEKMREIGVGTIATVMGRYYAMDRDKRWDRIQQAYDAMVLGKGNTAADAIGAIQKSYENGKTDEFMVPTVCVGENGQPVNLECRVKEILPLGSHHMFLAEVVSVSVSEQYFDANGKFHFNRSQPICYSHGAYYTLGESVGTFGYSVRKKTPIAKQMGRTTKKRQRNSSRRSHNNKKHKGE